MEHLKGYDTKTYLQNGFLTKPFLDDEYVLKKVNLDYNSKVEKNPNYTKIESLYLWINHVIKFSGDENFVEKSKFQRTAQEIWESGLAVGCSDYAILFATFARQLGWPTTILATAEIEWFKKLQSGKNMHHSGHYFCECYFNGRWLLVDPTCRRIEKLYSTEVINLSYTIHNSNQFIPYLRCRDLGKKQTINQHNLEMDVLCQKINIKPKGLV